MKAPFAGLLCLALCGAGCAEELTSPSGTTANVPVAHESFVGTVEVNGTPFYSFTVPQSGNVALTLLELRQGGALITPEMGVGLGIPAAQTCALTNNAVAAPSGKAQLTVPVSAGVYCVRLADVGNLTAAATFAVNISRPR